MPRYALLLSYHGGAFAGMWQQPGQRTVGAVIRDALARLGEDGVDPVPAARTDAGVHAYGQVAHVDLRRAWCPAQLATALDHHLPIDCSCSAAALVADTWHAGHHSRHKTYHYQLDGCRQRDPLRADRSWRPPQAGTLSLAALNQAAALITGRLDCRAFARRGDHRDDYHVTFKSVTWTSNDHGPLATLCADRFTYRLVRSLVGAMVACAAEACTLEDLHRALHGHSSPACRHQAPAQGLHLHQVSYRPGPDWRTQNDAAFLQPIKPT
ncbi:MAG: tRNA pseudouridine synthase A [Planctomycetota bacterium]